MNPLRLRRLFLLVLLPVSGGLALAWWALPPAARPAPDHPPARAAAARPPSPVAKDAAALVARQVEWSRITDSAAADRVEIELKDRITDENAEAIVRALPGGLLETQFGFRALERWAALDREAALEWLSRQENPTPFQLASVVRGWTARDRDSMRGYAGDLPAGSWRERVLAEMSADALHAQEPLESVALLRTMQPGETPTRLLRDSVALWAQSDPESASEWVSQVGDPELQRKLVRPAAIGYAFAEPRAATEWLRQSLPPGAELDEAMGDVVSVWAGNGRAADAASWVAALPEGRGRDVAVQKLLARWQEFDPGAAAVWARGLPAGSLRKQAEDSLASTGTALR